MKNEKLKRMVGIALLMSLVVVMQFLSGIIPPVGGFSISLVLIPIVLGAAVYGVSAGAILGATFGVVVYINCITGADVGGAMVFQANPVLCFLVVVGKGVLAGIGSGFVYSKVRTNMLPFFWLQLFVRSSIQVFLSYRCLRFLLKFLVHGPVAET